MQSDDDAKRLRDEAVAFRSRTAEHEIPDMPGWTIEALNRAIDEGLASGPAVEFDFDAFIAAIKDDDEEGNAA